MNGTIKRLVKDKGFGFVKGPDGVERFFHRSATDGEYDLMEEGDAVTFDDTPGGSKGPRAENVRPAR